MSAELARTVEAVAPLWAGEAEVVRTYFDSPKRSRESDMLWLRRQCKKEFWDSIHLMDTELGMYLGPLEMMRDAFPRLETEVDRHEVLEMAETLYEEFRHYVMFADVYDLIRGAGDPPLNIQASGEADEWAENQALGELRQSHRKLHGDLGARACRFTEGGYCTLYREGARRAGKGKIEDAIAKACQVVLDDELEHMMKGIVGLDDEGLDPDGWSLFETITKDQMKARIRMRNAQFGYPLSTGRVEEIFDGKIEPLRFEVPAIS
ncbi:MAG: hypothetical protein O3A84_08285 [Proteobacteria bacterium]|nr:hypothetical protein [Pseudomonadota bacterium]